MLLDYELIGSLQISNGIVSGFNNSVSNYIKIPYSLPMGSNKVEFCLSLYYPALSSSSVMIANYNDSGSGGGLVLRTDGNYSDIKYWAWNSSGSLISDTIDLGFDLTAGTNIIKFVYENSTITWYKSINGKDFTQGTSRSGTIADFKNYFVIGASGTAWKSGNMQVNMLDSYIKVNDEYWHSKEYSKQKTKIIQRHDTAANWTSVNPVLAAGEMGIETDTNKFKFGDGATAWSSLAYAAGEGGGSASGTTLTSTDGATTYTKLALGDTLSVTDTSTKELNKLTQTGGTLNSELEFTGASGASLKMNEKYSLSTADSWEFQIKYKHNGGGNSPTIFGYAGGSDYKTPSFILEGGSFKFFLSSTGGSWNLNSSGSGLVPQTGTIYYFKIGFTGSQYYVKYNTTGWADEFTTQWTLNSTTKVYCSDYFMLMNLSLNSGYYNTGTMYLQDTALFINGSEVWRGAKIIPGDMILNVDAYTKAETDDLLNEKEDVFATKAPLTIIPKGEQNVIVNGGKLTDDYIYYCKNPDNNTYGQVTSKELIDFSQYSSYEIGIKFEYQPSPDSKLKYVFEAPNSFLFGYWNSNMQISIYPAANYTQLNLVFNAGTVYYLNFSYNGSSYKLQYNTTGWDGTFSSLFSKDSTTRVNTTTGNTIFGGKNSSSNYLPGGLYVLESYYQLGNEPRVPLWLQGPAVRTLAANPATTSSLGVVQPDGTSITVNESGIISGQDVKTFTGYSDTGTLVLKSINGVLQWVAEA